MTVTSRHQSRRSTPRSATPGPREPTADLRPVEGAKADRELADLARAVSSEVRVKMLRVLARGADCCATDMRAEIRLAQPTISQHLQILRDAGLVLGRAEGRRVRYSIAAAALRRLKALVASL